MTVPTLAIAQGTVRSLRNHMRRAFGGVIGARVALGAAAAVVVAFTLLVYAFYNQNFAGAFAPDAPTQLVRVRSVLLHTQLITSATLALMLVVFGPTGSGLTISARIAGARPRQIAVGEFLPTTIGLCLAAAGVGVGPARFESQHQAAPALSLATLLLSGVAFTVGALVVCHAFSAVAALLRLPGSAARMVGLVAGCVFVAILLLDVLRSSTTRSPGVVDSIARWLWVGESLPVSAAPLLVVSLVVLIALALDLLAVALAAPRETLGRARRIVPLPRLGSGIAAFALREIVLSLRHPIAQLCWLIAALLAGGLIALVRIADAPLAVALIAFPLLFSTLAESAYGRSAGWSWVYRANGLSYVRQIIGQWVGAAVPSLVVCIALLPAVVSTPSVFFAVAPYLAVTSLAVSAIAYLSGTVVPYSGGASIGMMLTSVATLGAESAMLYLVSLVSPQGSPGAALAEVGFAILALVVAVMVARKRGFSPGQT